VGERFPTVTSKQLVKVLKAHGFEKVRQTGSHLYLRHPDGRWTTVPMHARDVGRGLTRKIIADADLTVDDLR
jgi:predicted RNA binding protein YcfA (HicA-like mRNA interferase family)